MNKILPTFIIIIGLLGLFGGVEAISIEEPIANHTTPTGYSLEYSDEFVIIDFIEDKTIIHSDPRIESEDNLISYKQKAIERRDYAVETGYSVGNIRTTITFAKPLSEDEVEEIAQMYGFRIVSLNYISTEGGGGVPYPIDHERLARMEQTIATRTGIEDFVLIKGYVSARILVPVISDALESSRNMLLIDVGPVEFLELYPDAIIIPGRSLFYIYNETTVSKDVTPPQITYVNVTPQFTNSPRTITITANVTDNVVVDTVTATIGEVTAKLTDLDGDGIFTNTTVPVPSIEGTYGVTVTAIDLAGNSAYNDSVKLVVDNTPPLITITLPLPQNYSYTEDITLNFNATDELSGVVSLLAELDGTSVISGETVDLFNFTLGEHALTVLATDGAGNNATESVTFTVIDDIPPETTDNADEEWHTSDIPITLTSEDEKSSVKEIHYIINDGTEIVVDSDTVQFAITYEDNNNTLKYWAVDEWGNVEEPNVVVGIKLDKTSPVTTDDADSKWHNNVITVTLSAIDPQVQGTPSGVKDTYYIIYEDERPQRIKSLSADGQPLITYEDDDNWLEYWSMDVAGNEENHTLRKGIKLDKTPPVVSIGLDPAKDEYFNDEPLPIKHEAYDPVVQGTPSDAVSVIFDIDGKIVKDPTDITNWVGTHTLTATATDLAENNASASVTFTVLLRAEINIDPDTLNLYSNGNWITAYIEFPVENYDVATIDVNTVTLNGAVFAENNPKYEFVSNPQPVDKDGDGLPEFMVKFDRSAVGGLLSPSDAVTLSIRGEILEGTFEGSDTIRVTANGNNRTQKGASLKVDKKIKPVEIDGERDKSRAEVDIDLTAMGKDPIKAVLVREYVQEGLIIRNADGAYTDYGLMCTVGTVEHKKTVKYTLVLPEVTESTTYELRTVVEYQTVEDLETLEKTSYLTVNPKGNVKLDEGKDKKSIKIKGKGYSKVYWGRSNFKGGSSSSHGKKKGHTKNKGKPENPGKPDKPPKGPGAPNKPKKPPKR